MPLGSFRYAGGDEAVERKASLDLLILMKQWAALLHLICCRYGREIGRNFSKTYRLLLQPFLAEVISGLMVEF